MVVERATSGLVAHGPRALRKSFEVGPRRVEEQRQVEARVEGEVERLVGGKRERRRKGGTGGDEAGRTSLHSMRQEAKGEQQRSASRVRMKPSRYVGNRNVLSQVLVSSAQAELSVQLSSCFQKRRGRGQGREEER